MTSPRRSEEEVPPAEGSAEPGRAEVRPRAVVVTVGEELLLGRTVNTNAAWLGDQLAVLGVPVERCVVVGDRDDHIRRAVDEGLNDAPLVVVSGGLGPTADDRTRAAVADLLGLELELDGDVLATLERRFRAFGYDELPPSNRAQALVPRGAVALENPAGTAPALVMTDPRGLVALLPGPPRELRALFPQVEERIRAHLGPALRPLHIRSLHTTGIPESVLAPRVDEAMRSGPGGVEVAFLPGLTGVDLRLVVRDRSAQEAAQALDQAEAALEDVLVGWRFRSESGDLAEALIDTLRARGWRLAIAESCTGGLLAKRITDRPGASHVFDVGVVAYANEAKTRLLGVPEAVLAEHGAVSEAVARAMAEGAAERFGAQCAVGVTGVAGPGGGTEEKPVGTVFVSSTVQGRTRVERLRLPGDREAVRIRSAQAALALLLRMLETEA